MKEFNIVVPMAGCAQRFDYKFKPFIDLDNRVFIEHVLDSFKTIKVASYNFIVTAEQEKKENVLRELTEKYFPHIAERINVIVLSEKTKGPFQTVYFALQTLGKLDNIIICDCDHSLDIAPMIDRLKTQKLDVVVPIWNIKQEEQSNWGKVLVNPTTGLIEQFYEKEMVSAPEGKKVYGIIGCYFFNNSSIILQSKKEYLHFSSFLETKLKKLSIGFAKIHSAYFFGDKDMAQKAIQARRRRETIICDVDGVLIKHRPQSDDVIGNNEVLEGTVEKLAQWKKDGKFIVLATARPKRTKANFVKMLSDLGFIYDEIVMGLNPGPRYLINDLKPSNVLVRQSVAKNLLRNAGISDLKIGETNDYDLKIVKCFKGNSFSKTVLVENNDHLFVRKYILKTHETNDHYKKLRRQFDDIKRFAYYDKSIAPEILDFHDGDHCFYYDMEYVNGHEQLDSYDRDTQLNVLTNIVNRLSENVYCYKKINDDKMFIDRLFNTKIYPKLVTYQEKCAIMNHLINSESILVNGKKIFGLKKILQKLNIYNFNTEYLNPIHGDLTLENILYNEKTNDFKLIDMDGSRYVDTCYFDLGKIFQSTVANYKQWSRAEDILECDPDKSIKCVSEYFECIPADQKQLCLQYGKIMGNDSWMDVYKKGIFYMSMYFIRFVPFRAQINKQHELFAMVMAINWLNHIYNLGDEKNEN